MDGIRMVLGNKLQNRIKQLSSLGFRFKNLRRLVVIVLVLIYLWVTICLAIFVYM